MKNIMLTCTTRAPEWRAALSRYRHGVLSVLTLLLMFLCSSSATAGSWRVEIEGTWDHIGASPFQDTLYGIDTVTSYLYSDNPDDNGVLKSTFELTATLTWIPSSGNPNEPPPQTDKLNVQEYSKLELSDGGTSSSLNNGFGDEVLDYSWGKECVGAHLIQIKIDQSGGSYTATLPKRTIVGTTNDYGELTVTYGVTIDSRHVSITCPAVDNPYSRYREPALTGPIITNIRQPDGTMRGDTILSPYDGSAFPFSELTFQPIMGGEWHTLSSWGTKMPWHWYSSLTSESFSNSDTLASHDYPPGFTIPYSGLGTDHVHLRVTDPLDHVQGTANYYLHIHDKYEPSSWPVDSGYPKKVMGPDSEVPGWPTYPWIAARDPSSQQIPVLVGPQGSGASITFTTGSTTGVSVEGGLGVSTSDVDLHFGGGHDWSNTTDISVTVNPTPEIPKGFQTWAVTRPSVQRTKGHLDIYGTNGYVGTGLWRRDQISGNDKSFYYPYTATNTVPHDPDPNWNPPGYNQ